MSLIGPHEEALRHQAIAGSEDAWDGLAQINYRRRVGGLNLAAFCLAMAARPEASPESRAFCNMWVDRMLAQHGSPKPGWMQRRVAFHAEQIATAERELDDAGAPPHEDGGDPTKWTRRGLFALRRAMVAAGVLVEVA